MNTSRLVIKISVLRTDNGCLIGALPIVVGRGMPRQVHHKEWSHWSMVWADLMDGQCLTRRCLTLPFLLLHLARTLSLITMCYLHVGFHGAHTSHRETFRATGQAHLIMFADMVIKGFVVCGPKCTQRAEVCIHPTTH